jgi:RNA polymerase sigma factor (TIGR02999 family)
VWGVCVMGDSPPGITGLLAAWSGGEEGALEALMPLVHRELLRIARRHMRRERPGHTLQTSALVNETYIRLVPQRHVQWQNRAHFFAIAARLMRRILTDHARANLRRKRGGSAVQVSLSGAEGLSVTQSEEMVALDESLKRLAALDERKSAVVELHYFAGMTFEEMAEVLKVSVDTVKRDAKFALTFLNREMSREPSTPATD